MVGELLKDDQNLYTSWSNPLSWSKICIYCWISRWTPLGRHSCSKPLSRIRHVQYVTTAKRLSQRRSKTPGVLINANNVVIISPLVRKNTGYGEHKVIRLVFWSLIKTENHSAVVPSDELKCYVVLHARHPDRRIRACGLLPFKQLRKWTSQDNRFGAAAFRLSRCYRRMACVEGWYLGFPWRGCLSYSGYNQLASYVFGASVCRARGKLHGALAYPKKASFSRQFILYAYCYNFHILRSARDLIPTTLSPKDLKLTWYEH